MADIPEEKQYPEDEHLRQLREDPDRRMTRAEWEHEDSLPRQAANKRHAQSKHDREVSAEELKKHRHVDKRKVILWCIVAAVVLVVIFLIGFIPRHIEENKAKEAAKRR